MSSIWLEGPDGGGKSTLAKMLNAAFGYPIMRSPGPLNEENVAERETWYQQLTQLDGIIVDRCFFFSEYVYGNKLRHRSYVSHDDVLKFLSQYFSQNKNNILVLVDQDFRAVEKFEPTLYLDKEHKRDFEKTVTKNLDVIRETYREFFNELVHHHFEMSSVRYIHVRCVEDVIRLLNVIRRTHER